MILLITHRNNLLPYFKQSKLQNKNHSIAITVYNIVFFISSIKLAQYRKEVLLSKTMIFLL